MSSKLKAARRSYFLLLCVEPKKSESKLLKGSDSNEALLKVPGYEKFEQKITGIRDIFREYNREIRIPRYWQKNISILYYLCQQRSAAQVYVRFAPCFFLFFLFVSRSSAT